MIRVVVRCPAFGAKDGRMHTQAELVVDAMPAAKFAAFLDLVKTCGACNRETVTLPMKRGGAA